MDIPQGYKQTELGIIPEDWEVKQIRDGLTLLTDFDANGSFADMAANVQTYIGGGYAWYVRATDLEQQTPLSEVKYVDESSYRFLKKSSLYGGEVLLAKRGEIGKVYLFEAKTMYATLAPNLYLLKLNQEIDSNYLYYYLKSTNGQKALKDINASTSLGALYKEDVKNLHILYPSPVEQRAIAEALSDIDGLIAALDKKIAKKRLIKQGTMQQLLTGKKRLPCFTDDWFEIRLGDYTAMNSGGTPSSSIPEYYNGDIPFLSISDITTSGKYIKKTEKTITKKGLQNSSAKMFPQGTIMYAMYASLGKTSIADIELSCSQAILGITPNDKIDSNYLYYYLSFVENSVKEMGQTGTQTNLSKQIVQDFLLYIPNQSNEQQAIATILSDMDKEIAALEARRDKFRLLKSGMMQKLLTGQIRLIKSRAKVVPLVPEVFTAREIPVDAHILAGHIVNRLWQSKGWGRTKLQKSLHLIGYCVQLNLGNEYIRNTAGPDDQLLMNYIDQKFKQYRHVKIVKERWSDGTVHYSYFPTSLVQELEMAYERYPQDIREHIDMLLDKLSTMNLAGAEILSTLYAVWNNRIIKGEQVTDDLLLADFYAWSKHKADFEERKVRKALDYMRKENIIPVGWGKYIDKK